MMNISDKFSIVIDEIEREFDELNELMMSVEIMSDHKLYMHYSSKMKSIEQIVKKIKELKKCEIDYEIMVELRSQGENVSQEELEEIANKKETLANEIKEMFAVKNRLRMKRL